MLIIASANTSTDEKSSPFCSTRTCASFSLVFRVTAHELLFTLPGPYGARSETRRLKSRHGSKSQRADRDSFREPGTRRISNRGGLQPLIRFFVCSRTFFTSCDARLALKPNRASYAALENMQTMRQTHERITRRICGRRRLAVESVEVEQVETVETVEAIRSAYGILHFRNEFDLPGLRLRCPLTSRSFQI